MCSCWDIFCILQLFNFFFLFCNFEFFVRPGSQDKWKHPYHSEQTTGTLKPFQGLTILGIWKFCFVYVFISFNFYTDIFRDLRNFFHSLHILELWPAAQLALLSWSWHLGSLHPSSCLQKCMKNPISPGQLLSKNHQTWSPIDPDTIHVPVGYEQDRWDLGFSSIHTREVFDCRKPRFSKVVLKPQFMTREAHRVFILGCWNLPSPELWVERTVRQPSAPAMPAGWKKMRLWHRRPQPSECNPSTFPCRVHFWLFSFEETRLSPVWEHHTWTNLSVINTFLVVQTRWLTF